MIPRLALVAVGCDMAVVAGMAVGCDVAVAAGMLVGILAAAAVGAGCAASVGPQATVNASAPISAPPRNQFLSVGFTSPSFGVVDFQRYRHGRDYPSSC